MKIVVCSGGFDPLHSGHITYFRAAQALGDKLIVGINSDEWLQRKKGKPFMSWYERSLIVGSIRFVDFTMSFDDDDDSINFLNSSMGFEAFENSLLKNPPSFKTSTPKRKKK